MNKTALAHNIQHTGHYEFRVIHDVDVMDCLEGNYILKPAKRERERRKGKHASRKTSDKIKPMG